MEQLQIKILVDVLKYMADKIRDGMGDIANGIREHAHATYLLAQATAGEVDQVEEQGHTSLSDT